MPPPTYTLLHYEDEPMTVEWLEDAIYLALCEHFAAFADCDEESVCSRDENARQITFHVPTADPAEIELLVRYRICTTRVEFSQALEEISDPSNTVIILDMMEQMEQDLVTSGGECYAAVPASILVKKRFFLSGYTNRIPKDIVSEIGEQSVFNKPVNVPNFTAAILAALDLDAGPR